MKRFIQKVFFILELILTRFKRKRKSIWDL
jgi:hypothetical protein